MRKLAMLVAGGVGYVLGAKAGRTRYEQLRKGAQTVRQQAPAVKEKVAAAAEKVRPHHDDRAAGVPTGEGWPADSGVPYTADSPRPPYAPMG